MNPKSNAHTHTHAVLPYGVPESYHILQATPAPLHTSNHWHDMWSDSAKMTKGHAIALTRLVSPFCPQGKLFSDCQGILLHTTLPRIGPDEYSEFRSRVSAGFNQLGIGRTWYRTAFCYAVLGRAEVVVGMFWRGEGRNAGPMLAPGHARSDPDCFVVVSRGKQFPDLIQMVICSHTLMFYHVNRTSHDSSRIPFWQPCSEPYSTPESPKILQQQCCLHTHPPITDLVSLC